MSDHGWATPAGAAPESIMPPRGRIALATPSVAYEHRVQQAFGGTLNGTLRYWRVTDDSVTLDRILADHPHALVLGPDLDLESAFETAARLDRDHPEVSVVLVTEPTEEVWRRALRTGIREVLPADAPDAQIRETLTRAVDVADRRRRAMNAGSEGGPGRHVLAVASPKGGAGKTMVASNLAVVLARTHPGEVVLADLDLRFGDVASALQLDPEHTVADAAVASASGDPMAMKVFLTGYGRDLFVLCAPESPAAVDHVTGDQVTETLGLLSEAFRFVVVDTAAGLEEHTLAATESATDLLLVCPLDVSGIRSLAKELAVLDELALPATRHLVVNRADSRVGVTPEDVEATLGLPPVATIPSSRAVPFAMNQGVPVVDSEPRSAVARSLGDLAAVFAGAERDGNGSWLRRWRS